MDVDSKAVFAQRLLDLGIGSLGTKFRKFGWDKFGCFAFAVPSTGGGATDDQQFRKDVICRLCESGEDDSPPQSAAIRRLWFEAHVVAVGELRRRVDRTDEDVPRRISQPERESRKNALRQRLQPGLIVAGLHDPGDSIINRFQQMVDENLLGWVHWECCPTFGQELDARSTKKRWLPDSKGVVTERTLKDTPEANTSDHLFIDLALQRRGLAADIAGVMSFDSHEVIRRRLMMALVEDPPDSRYSRPSIEHVRNADKFFWGQMAKECASGIKPCRWEAPCG